MIFTPGISKDEEQGQVCTDLKPLLLLEVKKAGMVNPEQADILGLNIIIAMYGPVMFNSLGHHYVMQDNNQLTLKTLKKAISMEVAKAIAQANMKMQIRYKLILQIEYLFYILKLKK